MELVFIRHAEANQGIGSVDDTARCLTQRGQQVQEQVARQLQRRGFSPDVILTSPRLRAEQTARITAEVLAGDVPFIEIKELDGGGSLQELLLVLEAFLDCETITCVGHEPDMTFWTNSLLSENETQLSGFSNSMVVSLVFDSKPAPGKARCNYRYTPDDLLFG